MNKTFNMVEALEWAADSARLALDEKCCTRDCPVNANGYHSPLVYKGVNQGRVLYACEACGRVKVWT